MNNLAEMQPIELARRLMEDDAESFKAGYSLESAVLAVQSVHNLTDSEADGLRRQLRDNPAIVYTFAVKLQHPAVAHYWGKDFDRMAERHAATRAGALSARVSVGDLRGGLAEILAHDIHLMDEATALYWIQSDGERIRLRSAEELIQWIES